ncbi:MAG: hypothetical protein DPW14_16300 [Planctomycetes bacterium]|nr:hypothetical protein [Planctomycetota bacterium]
MYDRPMNSPKTNRRRRKCLAVSLLALALLWFAPSVIALNLLGSDEASEGARADCIFVPGMAVYGERKPGLGLQARLERALELWRDKRAPLIVVSGGDKGDFNESEVMVEWLREHGVPGEAIIAESRSHSTRENATLSAPLMQARGIRSALIVSQWFHLPRVGIALRDAGIETVNVPCQGPPWPAALPHVARESLLMPLHAAGIDRWFE